MSTGLVLRNISKHFAGVCALNDVSLSAAAGEVHALLGQNGSGKSTLVKVMAGFHQPDPGGTMELWGRPVALPVRAAHEDGIAVIHQDLGLVETMTVLENMAITSGFGSRMLLPISMRAERRVCVDLLDELSLEVRPDTLVADLSSAERATLAIARAIRVLREHTQQFVFVLDEPTASLNAEESDKVLTLMRSVADAGNAVIFISHRLHEVESIADRVTVLRDAEVVDTFAGGESDQRRIISAMLGRSLESYYPVPSPPSPADPVLDVKDLSGRRLRNLSFDGRPGEIIGFAGLVGMGHEEIPYLLAGAHAANGTIGFADRDLTECSAAEIIDLGVSLVPANRRRDGNWPEARVSENLALLRNRHRAALSMLHLDEERADAAQAMSEYGVQPPDPDYRLNQFSGGNQQKVLLAKWMRDRPALLLLDEPTQGIDAGARFDVLQLVCDAADGGAVVVIASGDYEQLAHVCHRILVIRFGIVVAELTGDQLTEEQIAYHSQNDHRQNDASPGEPTSNTQGDDND